MQSYGSAGISLRGRGPGWGRGQVKAGAAGERATVALLEAMYGEADFDVYLFNDVSVPWFYGGNADHVVVRGRHVLIIDSKRWAPGFYWGMRGCWRGRRRFPEAEKTKATVTAADNFRRWLAERLGYVPDVSAMVLVHPRPRAPGRYRTWALRLPSGLPLRVGPKAEGLIAARLGRRAQPDSALLEAINSLVRS
ncbi:MAG: NERD domain-containing protein [Actinomycetota bacterium]|nr:NERD domain-containing protein [Actinomycetota bacterium]MDQ6946952.1 NERD domain-containing protein [Actinomycetota bacterium]